MSALKLAAAAGLAFDMARLFSPGGKVIGMDIDQTKLELAKREAKAQQLSNIEFRQLYTQAAPRRGADPNIGPRLPGLFTEAGFEVVTAEVVHHQMDGLGFWILQG
jgi:2-polyprenyl-3-methyl-5-hydroxy-6-metoxy-1,4-benzoquinol methylase